MIKRLLLVLLLIVPLSSFANDRTAPSAADFNLTEFSEESRIKMIENLRNSIPDGETLKPGGITLDIRAAVIIVQGLSTVAQLVYGVLLDVIIWLIWIFFAFWMTLLAWSVINTKTTAREAAEKIAIKALLILAVVFFLSNNPAEWFMLFMGAISRVGNYAADLFLLSATKAGIGQSCYDVQLFVINNLQHYGFLGVESISNIICLTGRINSFFPNAILESLSMVKSNIGLSPALAVVGVIGAITFIYCTVKFTLMTLGIVMDTVLMLMFLPFVAFKECFKDGFDTDTPVGKILDQIANGFGGEDLNTQIQKMIQIVLRIIALALVAAICYLIMQGIYQGLGDTGFMSKLLAGGICVYIISQTESITDMLTGRVDDEWTKAITKTAKTLADGGKTLYGNSVKTIKSVFKK
ncbi:MAG: hypothetical protein FWD33_04350 [Alphaproteobacteria bacterium]|nr:hypothetical protein [Alphaproteobacteria bacterium]